MRRRAEIIRLLDTNICIYILADAQSSAARRLEEFDSGEVCVSSISFAEIAVGVLRDPAARLDIVTALFEQVPVQPFDQQAALHYARLPFRRRSFDRLIAAHALSLGATLVTNNPRDFADIPALRIENWQP